MFETEIIINAALYALNQSVNSHIDVLGIGDSSRALYFQVRKLCTEWGVSDIMLQDCWQFDVDVWKECTRKFGELRFIFDSAAGDINVVIYPGDMVFFFTDDISLEEIEEDSTLEFCGTKYECFDLTDGVAYYASFNGFEDRALSDTERYALLHKVAVLIDEKSGDDFIKQLVWTDLLYKRYGCVADSVGNMPCDNGALCDRCHCDQAMQAAYDAIMRALNLSK